MHKKKIITDFGEMMVQGQKIIFDLEDSARISMFNDFKLEKTKGFIAGYKESQIDGVEGYSCKIYLHKFLTGSKYVRWLNGNKFDFRKINMLPTKKPYHPGPPCGFNIKGNEYRKEEDKVVILINRNGGVHEVFIDNNDLLITSKYTWYVDTQGYASSREHLGRGHNVHVSMHRLLMEEKNPRNIVDHINGNRLDNRRINLRICDHSQNCHNKLTPQGTGIRKSGKGWRATMFISGVKFDKHFKNYQDAINQRIKWCEEFNPSGLSEKVRVNANT